MEIEYNIYRKEPLNVKVKMLCIELVGAVGICAVLYVVGTLID